MREFTKPNVVISKCITFAPVRYNGLMIASDFVEKLKNYVNFFPVCPEVEIGLGVPREPVRIVLVNGERRLLQPATGLDLTEKMKSFAESFLNSLSNIDGFILKRGSPSSGFKNVKVYPGIQKSAPVGKGPGFFGEAVLNKFANLAIEDELRLINLRIREHFLTKLFTLARFREAKQSGKIKDLVRFHSENKYLLTAYNQKELRIMGKLVANQEQKPIQETFRDYEVHLFLALSRKPSVGSYVNVLLKIMGYFSNELSKDEKAFFIESVERYRAGRLPLSANLSILRSWIVRFRQDYLAVQSILEPYPEQLTTLETSFAEDSGKYY
ncbi:DUF1722 domain-containing protein [Candidatus Bathyarchaeota archaeon]|nr:DUF1722 domain-containing protein [Candidatus Bathyarchaeota archaeon]